MGKVITEFDLGWPGAISRSVDDIVISKKNNSTEPIPFGVPVFLSSDGSGVEPFANTDSGGTPQTFATFVGFSVRSAAKTPDTYPLSQEWSSIAGEQAGAWNPGDMVEILVRGTIAVKSAQGFDPGGKVYIRKSDGRIVKNAGTEGATVLLENVRCRVPQVMGGACNEMLVTTRNVQ